MPKGVICLYTNDIVSDSVQKGELFSVARQIFLGNSQPLRINLSP